MKKAIKQKLPRGWDEEKIRAIIEHYDNQTDEEGAAEIETAFNDPTQTMMLIPTELVPKIAWLIAQHQESNSTSRPRKRKSPRKSAKRLRQTLARKTAR
jgi:hypothetical protein